MKIQIKPGTLFVVSAPSGAGKTTLVHEVIHRLQGEYDVQRVITYTSKTPRPGEINGVDYHFVTEEEFKAKIETNFFVEYSTVYGAYYGFPSSVLDAMKCGTSFIAIVDRAGAASLKACVGAALLIWIMPPSKEALAERLAGRAQDSDVTIAFRLAIAEQELSNSRDELFDHFIVNDNLENAINELALLVNNKLKHR